MAALQLDPVTGLPIIPKDWLTIIQQPEWWNESTGQMEQGQQRVDFTEEARLLLGGGGANFGSEGFNYGGNFDWRFGTTDPTGYYNGDPILHSLLKKTGEREGTRYGYTLDANGNYVPTATPLGTEYMYTNNGDTTKKALMAAAAVAGGGLLGNLAMTGNMFTAAAPGAMDIGSLFGAGAGAGAGSGSSAITAADILAQPGLVGNLAMPSIEGLGSGVLGDGLMSSILAAGDTPLLESAASFGATGSVPFGTSVANIGLVDTLLNSVPSGVTDVISTVGDAITGGGGDLVGDLISGGVDLVGGAIIGDTNENATDTLLADTTAAAGGYKQAGMDYAAGLRDLIPGLAAAYSYNPATVNNGFGQSEIDPATGNVRFSLNAPWEQAYRGQMGAGLGMLSELGNTNPNDIAKRMYDERMALLAPSREKEQQGLLQQLYNKGGFGLSVNTPTQLGTMGINPLVNSFAAANAQQDRQMAYDSWNQGQSYLDSLLNRQRGLFTDASGVLNNANGAVTGAQNWGNTLTGNNMQAANMIAGTQRDALGAERDAVQRYIETVLGAQNRATASDAAARTSTTGAVVNGLGNLPWTDIFRGIGGLFD